MAGSKRVIGSDLAKVDAHVITPEEYEEIPELTDEFFETADVYVGGKLVSKGRPRSEASKQVTMATNPPSGDGHRNDAVKNRSQVYNPKTETWTKRDTETGRFMDGKKDGTPFKGVRKEEGKVKSAPRDRSGRAESK